MENVIERAEQIRLTDESILRGLGRFSMVNREESGLPITERAGLIDEIADRNRAVLAIRDFDSVVGIHHPDSPEFTDAQNEMHTALQCLSPQRMGEAMILAQAQKFKEREVA